MGDYHRPVRQFFSIILIVQIIAIVAILGLIIYGVDAVETVADQHTPSAQSSIFHACFRPIW